MFTGFASPKRTQQNPEPDTLPTFGSQGKRFRVVTNDTVVLPCDVINPGEYDIFQTRVGNFFSPDFNELLTDRKEWGQET